MFKLRTKIRVDIKNGLFWGELRIFRLNCTFLKQKRQIFFKNVKFFSENVKFFSKMSDFFQKRQIFSENVKFFLKTSDFSQKCTIHSKIWHFHKKFGMFVFLWTIQWKFWQCCFYFKWMTLNFKESSKKIELSFKNLKIG